MKKLTLSAALIIIALAAYMEFNGTERHEETGQTNDIVSETEHCTSDEEIGRLYRENISDVQITACGTVERLLSDDEEGSRHQRMIMRLSCGQTLLIAHNIDIAGRVDGVREGSRLIVFGEYEWNGKGGVVHWTHRDPNGAHVDGWIEYQGKRYQ